MTGPPSDALVSIGIPTHMRAATLERTLRSALAQTHRALELVVSDQASSDGTEELCRALAAEDGRIRYLRHATSAGGSTANFNLLGRELRGDWAMLLADDDWLDPDYVARCLAVLQADPGCAVAYGRARYFDGDRRVADGVVHEHREQAPDARVRAYFRTVDDNGVMYGLMRGDALRGALPMPNALGNDWLLMGRVAATGTIVTLDDVHVNRAVGGTSASTEQIARAFGVSQLQARLPHLTIAWQVLADVGWRSAAFASLPARRRTALAAARSTIHWRSLAHHALAPVVASAARVPGLGWLARAQAGARRRWGGDGTLSTPPEAHARGSAPCRLCGREATLALVATDRNRRVSAEPFRYVRCATCGTVTLADVPDDLGRFYPPEYHGLPDSRAGAVARDPNAPHRLALVRTLVPAGRLVEIGPSVGAFVALAQDAGYDTTAIEMDPGCCRFIRDVVGVPVAHTADPADALDGTYDAIVLWHVIEHLSDPAAFLARAAAALAPGGAIVLMAPNPESLQYRLLGRRWAHLDAPRHLALLPLDAVAEEAARHGLEVALATTADEDAIGSNGFGWRVSLGAAARNATLTRGLHLAGTAAAAALAPLERSGRRGSTYTLALRKPAGGAPSRSS
ncbi:MAG TPA: glycosyltransferase [Conexibacter sp.]|nr:glycosyltransferase [Conexibacter sp.]